MSDRIAVMFEGRIAQMDDPETLYRRPKSGRWPSSSGDELPARPRSSSADGAMELDVAGLGRARVEAAQCAGPIGAGACSVGVRPETMSVLFEGETSRGRVAEGTVDEVVYYGDMTYYDIRLDGTEKPVRISMRNLIGRPVLDIRTRTRVSWDERSLVLFPAG
jgi:spermidine/putrescine transport system ATP-binding protein